ncbi:thiamin pyrophosphokinase 1 isoform X2 [Sitophilus oryzae]|uniref:Thiamine pyrophosphokinase 1 n=1 Tax=Sitophilus oryzae TaxID=7048 RepID=A0A6J2XXR8_SITOR|nr:thiamin pyrophosphokinase 1 isoform X2 [Sitophilus oryzae]
MILKMNNIDCHESLWTPCEDILRNFYEKNYAVVVLNCRIDLNVDHRKLLNLWTKAKLRITVDGGTRRWLKWLEAHEYETNNTVKPPDLITGDMDSLPPHLLSFFEEKGSKVIRTPDQNQTDFTKALRELKTHCEQNLIEVDTVFVLADTSGRFDQIIANINTLYKASEFLGDKKIYQIASNSISWLLQAGNHRISIPENLRRDKEWCALIPMGAPCIVTTTGLKWNLDKSTLNFGGMVSTSNTYSGEPYVTVSTDRPLLWSMGIEAIL